MKKILIIDDDDSVRRVLKMRFESNYEIIDAEDGKKGFDMFTREHPDLIITDIIMPEEEGFKTIMNIKDHNPDTPVIVITGMPHIGGADSLEIAREFGADAGFLKPIDLKKLGETIKTLIS